MGVLHTTGALCTAALIFFDFLFSWCRWSSWMETRETAVLDPDNDEANLVWRDGKVVDLGDTKRNLVQEKKKE